MRYDVAASTNARVNPTRILADELNPKMKRLYHVKIQVFDPVTLYVSKRRMDLETTDVLGNPKKGFQFNQGVNEMWFVSGELWVVCNQQIEIEADAWPLPWMVPR